MLVAIATDTNKEDSPVSPVFGRSKFFALYDTSEKDLVFIENPGASQERGAGISAAQTLIDKKVEKVYCGNIGPNAKNAISEDGIKIEIVNDESVKDIINSLEK